VGLNLFGCEIRERTLCFVYSIMCVADSNCEEGRIREKHLPFEGFLEALVHLATVVPLPTDAMLKERDAVHAGALMHTLQASDEDTLKEMAKEQACEWGDVPGHSDSMARRVEYLVDIMVRKIKMLGTLHPEALDTDLTPLTRREFRTWALRMMGVQDTLLPETWTHEKCAVGEV
jgi:hypothetical protein